MPNHLGSYLPSAASRLIAVAFALFCIAAVEPSLAQTLTVSPFTGRPGQTVTVSGSGFANSEAVDIYFDTSDLMLKVTSATGTLPATPITVPLSATPGTHWITVIGRRAGDAAQKAYNVNTNWAQYGFNAPGKRYNAWENVINASNVAQLNVAWRATTERLGFAFTSPAVANGKVYVGSRDGKLYAFNANTGAKLWAAPTGDEIRSSPAVAYGKVYVGSNDGKLYAFDAKSGATKWSVAIGSAISSSPVVANGLVYVGSNDSNLYAFDAKTGAELWTASIGSSPASPVVADGVVYIASYDKKLYAFNAKTGDPKWTATSNSFGVIPPVVANGLVYAPADYFTLAGFNAVDGTVRWYATMSSAIVSSSAVARGVVYFGTSDGRLNAFSTATGTGLWTTAQMNTSLYFAPAVANGVVYMGPKDNHLFAYSTSNGATLWKATTGSAISSSPAVSNGMVYVGTSGGELYAFALNAGDDPTYKPKATAPMPYALVPDMSLKPGVPKSAPAPQEPD